MTKFSVYRNINNVTQGHVRDLGWVIDRVRSGANKQLIDQIRAIPDKSKRDELKKGLTSICFSGVFRKREDRSIISHSGYMVADFDHVDDLQALRDTLCGDKYVHLLFTSPSGDGLKAVFKVPPVAKEHKARFRALMDYFDRPDFDPKNGNLSRVCYESYDPDLYYNPESELFTDMVEHQPYRLADEHPPVRLSSPDKIITKLQAWSDKRFPIVEGQRNDNMFRLASAMNRYGVPKVKAENYLKQYAQQGFDVDEIIRVVGNAYRDEASYGKEAFNDDDTEDYIRRSYSKGLSFTDISKELEEVIPQDKERAQTIERIIGDIDDSAFWHKDKRGKVSVDHYKFKKFLQDYGYMKFYPTPGAMFVFVKVTNNLVAGCIEETIKDFVLEYLENDIGDRDVFNHVAGRTAMFKKEYLSMLDAIHLPFVRDEVHCGHLFYRNCTAKVWKDGKVDRIDYADLGGYVWEDHIIDRDYEEDPVKDGEWNHFVELVSGQDNERIMAHRTTMGYLMHGYKDKTNNFAVIYNDGVINDNPNGGSGKGIIMQALSKLKRVSVIDGKSFSFDKGFPYQTVSADTQILLFDDVNKRFNFERLFSVITEGLELEKKNKDAVRIPVERSPKVVITTNYTIPGKGGSHERRRWEVEMSPYFNATRRPQQVFGHNLFDDWDAMQWRRFDNYMIECLAMYLDKGLYQCSWETQHIRKFINETSQEFWEWATDETENRLGRDVVHYRAALMDAFVNEYPDWGKHRYNLSARKWYYWLEAYGAFKGWEVVSGKNQQGHYTKYVEPGTVVDVAAEVVEDDQPF